MDRFLRFLKFMIVFIPVTILNGFRMIVFEDISVDEIMFEVSRPKKKSKGISKKIRKKIVQEYLDDCLRRSLD